MSAATHRSAHPEVGRGLRPGRVDDVRTGAARPEASPYLGVPQILPVFLEAVP